MSVLFFFYLTIVWISQPVIYTYAKLYVFFFHWFLWSGGGGVVLCCPPSFPIVWCFPTGKKGGQQNLCTKVSQFICFFVFFPPHSPAHLSDTENWQHRKREENSFQWFVCVCVCVCAQQQSVHVHRIFGSENEDAFVKSWRTSHGNKSGSQRIAEIWFVKGTKVER